MRPYLLLVALLLTPAIAWAAPFDITGPSGSDIDTEPSSPTVLSFTVTETGSIETLSLRLNIDEQTRDLLTGIICLFPFLTTALTSPYSIFKRIIRATMIR